MKKTEEQKRAAIIARPFVAGDIIDFCDEHLRVRENYGRTGVVEHLDGTLHSNCFYWTFSGESAELVCPVENNWTTTRPTETGLYAIIEPITSAGVNGRAILEVTMHSTGVLVYGGFARIDNALEGTLWLKLPPLPKVAAVTNK